MKRYVYLHGFASSPASSKAQYFKARFAERHATLEIPALDGGDFEHLTVTGQMGVLERELRGEACVLLGSSLGGYVAARYAEGHAEVERLVLLAPAFDFRTRWMQAMAGPARRDWQTTRKLTLFHYGERRQRQVDYGLLEDAARYPAYPDFAQPALVLHGRRDEIVPVEYARNFCALHPNAQLQELDSGHELTDVLPEMWARVGAFLEL